MVGRLYKCEEDLVAYAPLTLYCFNGNKIQIQSFKGFLRKLKSNSLTALMQNNTTFILISYIHSTGIYNNILTRSLTPSPTHFHTYVYMFDVNISCGIVYICIFVRKSRGRGDLELNLH